METKERVRMMLESTLLGPKADWTSVRRLCEEAAVLGIRGVCVPPAYVALAREVLRGTELVIVTVANFPFAHDDPALVRAAIRFAADAGAHEVDIVAPYAAAIAGAWDVYELELTRVIEGAPVPIKVILETAALPPIAIERSAEIACRAGASWLKTSTGFHPAGGATFEALLRMRIAAADGVRIKVSGGIRTLEDAAEYARLGAHSAGTSSARAILCDEQAVLGAY